MGHASVTERERLEVRLCRVELDSEMEGEMCLDTAINEKTESKRRVKIVS